MKTISIFFIYTFVLSKFLIGQCGGSPGQPEFYMFFKDNPGANYRVFAQKFGNSPIYDRYFLISQNYNYVWERTDDYGNPTSFYALPNYYTSNRGFDWVFDINSGDGCRGVLGYGIYKIEFQREISGTFVSVFDFYFDVRQTGGFYWSADLFFYFNYDNELQQGFLTVGQDINQREVQLHEFVNYWEEKGITRDWSGFIQSAEVLNDFNGSINYNINTTLIEAQYGFPEISYSPGYQFTPGSSVDFWKGAFYKFSVPPLVTVDDVIYKVRNWNNEEIYGDEVDIILNTSEVKAIYLQTIPLSVTNYLEGGTGGTYKVKWDKLPNEHMLNSGESYNAFNWSSNLDDRYDLTVEDFPYFNTSWNFLQWENGSTSTLRNVAVTATNKDFIANYKGQFRSDYPSASGSNGQRKMMQDDNGKYHLVYTSMNRLVYKKPNPLSIVAPSSVF